MLIIKLCGGLGNQLFQYALYKKLKIIGKTVRIDDVSAYRNNKTSVMLQNMGLNYERATTKEINRYEDNSLKLIDRIRRKLLGSRGAFYYEPDFAFDETVFTLDSVCLVGYWQTEMYFKDIRNELIEEIELHMIIDAENKKIEKKILNSNSVSLHIRRGDYLDLETQRIYGDICTEKYYKDAMQYIEKRVSNVQYFIFTNDIIWARKHFVEDNVSIVDINDSTSGHKDMYLMSKCKHNIIANSSFSWWGAWLNTNGQKIVVAPAKWLNTAETADIWCKGWTKLS